MMMIITPELQASGVAAWSAEAKRLHALADQWLTIDLDVAEASSYRKGAQRAERFADAWRNYRINPPKSPTAQPEGDDHGQLPDA
jgi:hypothetical protein